MSRISLLAFILLVCFALIAKSIPVQIQNPYDQTECPICLTELGTPETAPTTVSPYRCDHLVHESCHQSWMNHDGRACPICRARVIDAPSVQRPPRFSETSSSQGGLAGALELLMSPSDERTLNRMIERMNNLDQMPPPTNEEQVQRSSNAFHEALSLLMGNIQLVPEREVRR